MARDSKIQVGAINVRIPQEENRNYNSLLETLAGLRRGVRVYGESYLAISFFDPKTGLGVLSKYTEIDINGEWFDLDDFTTATPEKVDEISIPDRLKPNHSQFYFLLNEILHVIAFCTYSDSKGLSTRSVEKYFSEALRWAEISNAFGRVESDIVKSYDEVERILSLPDLKELRLVIRRPNTDDVGGSLARVIEERLREQNGDEYEEILRSRGSNSLKPSQQTASLAVVAAENGKVTGKSIVHGVLTETNTDDQPLIETTTYKSDGADIPLFRSLATKLFEKISQARALIS